MTSKEAVAHLKRDPVLKPIIDRHGGLTIEPADDFFERLVDSIVNQQLATEAASAIWARSYETVPIEPDALLEVDETSLRDVGLSRQKSTYVRNVAEAASQKGYNHAFFENMDKDEVISELTAIKGIGVWTAKMQLIFNLGRPDVFPVEDLGVRRAMETVYSDDLDRNEMVEIAENWRPYRSYASVYLWRFRDE